MNDRIRPWEPATLDPYDHQHDWRVDPSAVDAGDGFRVVCIVAGCTAAPRLESRRARPIPRPDDPTTWRPWAER